MPSRAVGECALSVLPSPPIDGDMLKELIIAPLSWVITQVV
jgi:hypothetical protein